MDEMKNMIRMIPTSLLEVFIILSVMSLFVLVSLMSVEVMNMVLSNKAYDIIKYIALIVLPAIGTLYFALASIWGLPYGQEVVGTITAIDTFLGALIGISAMNYKGEENERN